MAGSIPQAFIQDLIQRIDIVEFIDARISLKRVGGNYQALCPFHQEKSPSFVVSPQKQIYHCFGCGVKGNVIGFVMALDRKNFVETITELANHCGLEVPTDKYKTNKPVISQDYYQWLEEADRFYRMHLRAAPHAIEYLKQRGLTGEICQRFHVGYAPNEWEGLRTKLHAKDKELADKNLIMLGMCVRGSSGKIYDRFRNRIMFALRDKHGRVVGFGGRALSAEDQPKYLNSPETILFRKREFIYGLYEALQHSMNPPYFIVVEGYLDVMALAQFGVPYAVAVLGTSLSAQHLQQLFRYSQNIIFCFDGDSAGKQAARRAFETIFPFLNDERQINFMFLPEGEDPDSLVHREGEEGFKTRMEQAFSFSEFFFKEIGVQQMQQTPEDKARVIHQANQYLVKFPESALKQLVMDELATRLRVNADQFLQKKSTEVKNPIRREKQFSQKFSSLRMVLSLLLQFPELLRQHKEAVEWIYQPQVFSHSSLELLIAVVNVIDEHLSWNTAQLLEYFREHPKFSYLESLASQDIYVPESGLDAEFLHAVQQLHQRYQELNLEHLLQLGRQRVLTDEEKNEIQHLLSILKKKK